jgi:hypothetical protein
MLKLAVDISVWPVRYDLHLQLVTWFMWFREGEVLSDEGEEEICEFIVVVVG